MITLGTHVKWTLAGRAYRGVVIEVVADMQPRKYRGYTTTRKGESFIVHARNPKGRMDKFWPKASWLTIEPPTTLDHAKEDGS